MTIEKFPAKAKHPIPGELAKRIHDLISEYNGELGIAEVVGVLEIVKFTIVNNKNESIKGD